MSYKRSRPKLPDSLYKRYYKKMEESGSLYVIIPSDDDYPELHFSPSGRDPNSEISFVFFRKDDAIKYAKELVGDDQHKQEETTVWECSVKGLVFTIEDQVSNNYVNLDKTVYSTVIAVVYYNDDFRDMEVFWTNHPSKIQ